MLLCMLAHTQTGKFQFYTLNEVALQRNKADTKTADHIKEAYKQLIKDAEKAMLAPVTSVMEKTTVPPSGDKHDYMSLAPYFWPDTTKPDGLPYIRRDGVTNPEVKDYKDKDYMPKLCENVYSLALAYYFSNEDKYAHQAAHLIKNWFINADTRMNPNLNFGQAIKGRNDGRGAGLIDTRHFIKVVDAIGLINASAAWNKKNDAAMKKWFADFLQWMETSKNGLDEADAKNNHGVWYDAQRIAFAAYALGKDAVKNISDNSLLRLDKQQNAEGFFPEELTRTISLHYSAFVLDAFFIIAQVSKNYGINLYDAKTEQGKSLAKAFEAHLPYFTMAKVWDKGEQIKKFDPAEGYMILMEGYKFYNCKACYSKVWELEGEKAKKLRINLLY